MFMNEWWTTDAFIRFLRYLAEVGYGVNEIINIVEKPYHYEAMFNNFKQEEE